MHIKGGTEVEFQVDTGAACNIIKLCDLQGTNTPNKSNQTKSNRPGSQDVQCHNSEASGTVRGPVDKP